MGRSVSTRLDTRVCGMHRAGAVPDVTLSAPGSRPIRLGLNYWTEYKTPEILTINMKLEEQHLTQI